VQVAISSGRLSASITKAGKIRSCAAADEEWAATTHEDRIPLTGPTSLASAAAGLPPSQSAAPTASPLQEMRARREAAEAELAEIDLAKRKGELVQARDIESRLASLFVSCRTKVLGVPSRLRQLDESITDEQIEAITTLLREALDDLAAGRLTDGEHE
jgi:hypothetical protein